MKRVLGLVFLLSVTFYGLAQETPEGLFINSKAPDFRAKDQHGQEIHLKELLEKRGSGTCVLPWSMVSILQS